MSDALMSAAAGAALLQSTAQRSRHRGTYERRHAPQQPFNREVQRRKTSTSKTWHKTVTAMVTASFSVDSAR